MNPVVAQYLELGLIIVAVLAVAAGIPLVLARRSNRRREAALQPAANAPGWYPSPQQPGQLQWWNGTGWTDRFAPATPQ